MMIRSFLAIEIPEDIRKKMYESFARLHRQASSVKWVEAQNMHLTLHFLGLVSEELLENEIVPRLKKMAAESKALAYSLRGVGIFPSLQKPRIFWAGIEGDLSELKRLKLKIEKEFESFALPSDKKEFHPHITLGRIKELGDRKIWQKALEEYEKIDFGSFKAKELSLFKSELTSKGPLYTRIRVFALQNSFRNSE